MCFTTVLAFLIPKPLNNMEKDKHCNRKMGKSCEHTNHRREDTNFIHMAFNFTIIKVSGQF